MTEEDKQRELAERKVFRDLFEGASLEKEVEVTVEEMNDIELEEDKNETQ